MQKQALAAQQSEAYQASDSEDEDEGYSDSYIGTRRSDLSFSDTGSTPNGSMKKRNSSRGSPLSQRPSSRRMSFRSAANSGRLSCAAQTAAAAATAATLAAAGDPG